jgi:hypothetical protein
LVLGTDPTVSSFVTDTAYRHDVERMLGEAMRILDDLDFRHALGHGLLYWGAATTDQDDGEAGDSAVTNGASILAEVGDIPCAVNASIDMIDHQLGRNQVDKALAHLVFAARQSGADPPRFAHPVWRRRPVASWRRVANTGPRPPSSASSKQGRARGACRDIVMGGLDATEAEVLCGSGSRASDADILGHISAWAAGAVN